MNGQTLGYATIAFSSKNANKTPRSILTLKAKLLRVNKTGTYTIKTLESFESVLRSIPKGRIYTVKEFKIPDNIILKDMFSKFIV